MSTRPPPQLPWPVLLEQVSNCRLCEQSFDHQPRPVIQAGAGAKILIIGQAPGLRVHQSGVPWDDASGDRLRSWLGVDKEAFYRPEQIALVPMGFCYPGKGRSGDLPPPPICAQTWHQPLLDRMQNVELTLLVGQYAQVRYLVDDHQTVTNNVARWQQFWPQQVPLPHPSPRNRRWFANNPWFDEVVVPQLQQRVAQLLTPGG